MGIASHYTLAAAQTDLSPNTSLEDGQLKAPIIMPIVVKPKPRVVGRNRLHVQSTASSLVPSPDDWRKVLRSSFSDDECIVPYSNGLVRTILSAWMQDVHLELRPDDVWHAILVQFSFFVNGNAEALRSVMVAHEEG